MSELLVSRSQDYLSNKDVEALKYFIQDEVTTANLLEISALVNQLPCQDQYGYFESEEHYYKTLKLLHLSTLETQHREEFIHNCVLVTIQRKQNFLDLGSSRGELASRVAQDFEEITLVDIHRASLEAISNTLFPRANKVNKIEANIAKANLETDKYDLILISHVLYYIPYDQWLHVVNSAYSLLREGGKLVIIVSGKGGKEAMETHFGGSILPIDNFVTTVRHHYPSSSNHYSALECFVAPDIKSAMHIASMLLYDVDIRVKNFALKNYLLRNCLTASNLFKITLEQHFIVLEK